MKRSGDVIILGGGVIGLTTAYFLAKEGVQVVLCEQGKVGTEASWAGAGILPPSDIVHAADPVDRLRALSGGFFPDLSRELKERTGIDNGYARSGGLEFLAHPHAADAHEWYGQGISTKILSQEETARLEPALALNTGKTRLIPAMAQLRNPRHLQALRAACLATKKVKLLEDTPVQSFVDKGPRVQGVRTPSGVVSGESFVLAAGAWTDQLLEPLGCRLKIQPVRGQIALLNPGKALVQHILIWGAQYLVPRLDGRVLIGSTEENVGFDKNPTAGGIEGLLDLGMRLVPRLAEAALEKSWAGLRPGSPDGLPFIGLAPGLANLHVAAAHFRAGIQLSPGTALLVKERILGQPLSMAIEAFRLDR